MSPPERRVAPCKINYCCPFRSNLCPVSEGCHGSLKGRALNHAADSDVTTLTLNDAVLMISNGEATLYDGKEAHDMFVDFDAGRSLDQHLHRMTLHPPTNVSAATQEQLTDAWVNRPR